MLSALRNGYKPLRPPEGVGQTLWSQDCELNAGFILTKNAYCHYTIKAMGLARKIAFRFAGYESAVFLLIRR